ncbi:hypothetical protein C3L33_15709, partial [Rhododendron williamsianum]
MTIGPYAALMSLSMLSMANLGQLCLVQVQKISLVEIRIRFVGILTLTIVLMVVMGLVGGGEVEERTFRYNANQCYSLWGLMPRFFNYLNLFQVGSARASIPTNRPNGTTMPSTSTAMPHSQSQTVVVENPMSVDESGKLVSNVVVGVTTEKK